MKIVSKITLATAFLIATTGIVSAVFVYNYMSEYICPDTMMFPAATLRNYLIVITVLFILAATVCAFLISRTILLPLTGIRDAADEIGRGNLDIKIDIKSRDEVGDLARSFGNMVRRLKMSNDEIINLLNSLRESEGALKRYSLTLETRVDEKTSELRNSVVEVRESHEIMASILEDTVIARDKLEAALSELKKKEAELIASGKLAGIGELAAGIAHEINNPLTSILGYSQLVTASPNLDPQVRKDLQNIERESKRCVTIIENLLDFARPVPLKKTEIDLRNILENVFRLMEYSLQREQIEIVKSYAKDLPKVIADPHQMQQVFMNIVFNAMHAMPGGGTLTVATSLTHDAIRNTHDVCISFTDTGIGIPDDIKGRIFEPFFTTSYERGQKGSGLGLSISHSIISEHGGRIEVESEVGRGSTFRVVLPV